MSEPTAINCPGCGADNPLHNPGVVALVCAQCSIVIYREDAQLKAGKESILAPPMSNVAVGSMGRIRGRKTLVLGRIRLEHERGVWDEWYTLDGRGRPIWIVEEEGGFTLEKPIDNPLPSGLVDGKIGDTFSYMGVSYQITERGSGKVKGGEGQLPRTFTPGENFDYLDLTEVDGRGRLTVEVAGSEVYGFIGQALRSEQVSFPKVWGLAQHREAGKAISCSGCGGAIDVRPLPEPAKTVSCRYCGSVHSLYGDELSLLGKNEPRTDLHLMVGTAGTIKGRSYEVIGRMVYKELELDDGLWSTISTTCWEYLLLDEEGGFATVEVTDEGVALVRKTETQPLLKLLKRMSWGEGYKWRERTYRMYERGRSKLVYVDGALPWVAKLGDSTDFMDFIDIPSILVDRTPERLSLEWSDTDGDGGETEVFLAQDLDPTALANAFDGSIHPVVDTRVLRPHRVSPQVTRFGAMWVLTGMVFAVLALFANFSQGDALGEASIHGKKVPAVALSKQFEIEDNGLVRIVVETNVNNSWLWAEVDLVDAGTSASVGFVAQEVSYYHGVEGGESWSEGSRRWKRVYQIPKGGAYKLKLDVSETDTTSFNASASIYKVSYDTRYPLRFSLVLLFMGGLILLWGRIQRPNLWPSDDDD